MITRLQQERLNAIATMQDWTLIGLVVIVGIAIIWAMWTIRGKWK